MVAPTGAQHRNLEQTEKYIRTAEEVGTDIGEPFPALPPGLIDHVQRSRVGQPSETIVEGPGNRRAILGYRMRTATP